MIVHYPTVIGKVGLLVLLPGLLLCLWGQVIPAHAATDPKPIYSNQGAYLCPYKKDGSLAAWADPRKSPKKITVDPSQAADKTELQARQKAVDENYQKALKASLMDSDISFESARELSVYMYINYRQDRNYFKAWMAVFGQYPEIKTTYRRSIDLYKASQMVKRKLETASQGPAAAPSPGPAKTASPSPGQSDAGKSTQTAQQQPQFNWQAASPGSGQAGTKPPGQGDAGKSTQTAQQQPQFPWQKMAPGPGGSAPGGHGGGGRQGRSAGGPALPPLPEPIAGTRGKYMCPYKRSGALAAWADPHRRPKRQAANVSGGENEQMNVLLSRAATNSQRGIGASINSLFGGAFGGAVGNYVDDRIRHSARRDGRIQDNRKLQRKLDRQYQSAMRVALLDSDLSFNSLSDLAIYIFVKYRNQYDFAQTKRITFEQYPGLVSIYENSIAPYKSASFQGQ